MSSLGFKSVVFHGETCLGELDTVPVKDQNFQFPNNEIRIHHISPNSERCHPLSVLQTISSPVRCKLEPNANTNSTTTTAMPELSPLINLHASCFYELKTAVVLLGNEEIHLVAMPSKQKKFPCFWCFSVPSGLYSSCVGMLNMRCLALVFDLDETLIVANTMKSFEDRIEILRSWIGKETDPIRVSGMSAEMKRYMEDRSLLKQYIESDSVVDGGKVYKVQHEEVPRLSDGHEWVVRPVIRLGEKNLVLTRINPEIRDTSVLVRLRPAWEDLKNYLTAKGRRRFEVYVCTMAERDYALEMWRLLDPEAHLICSKQLLDRIVCVKNGGRKSLLGVFRDRNFHPNMAMVIDDRLKVWEDKDQPRVHVVPPFTPYYAPQAETANALPVLCVARNVACDVRGRFFKEFDEILSQRICEIFYEDEVANLPFAPDVSNYLLSEDSGFVSNGILNAPLAEGINGPEVVHRLNHSASQDDKVAVSFGLQSTINGPEMKSESSQVLSGTGPAITTQPLLKAVLSEKPSLLGVPFRRDSSFAESDPDAKRRFVRMNNGQDARYWSSAEPPILSKLPRQLPVLPIQGQGGWLVEEDINRGYFNSRGPGSFRESDDIRPDKQRGRNMVDVSAQSVNNPPGKQSQEVGTSRNQLSANDKESQTDGGRVNFSPSLSISVLQEIGRRCCSKVEFRPVVSTSEELQFSVEVFFTGEKIGVGMGKTRKDAQQHAAENALRGLADSYVSYAETHSGQADHDSERHPLQSENGFVWEMVSLGSNEQPVEDRTLKENVSETAEVVPAKQQMLKRANSSSALYLAKGVTLEAYGSAMDIFATVIQSPESLKLISCED